jgi:hypothetical protein
MSREDVIIVLRVLRSDSVIGLPAPNSLHKQPKNIHQLDVMHRLIYISTRVMDATLTVGRLPVLS